jgi:4-hydroxysphinganine ceramide fatty acyl 2-hydroxylase
VKIKINEKMASNQNGVKANRFLVKYHNDYYDLTEFAHKHPGGRNTLQGLVNTDMTNRFNNAPVHSDAAMYLMKEYKIKTENRNFSNGFKTAVDSNNNNYANGATNGVTSNGTSNGVANGKNGYHNQVNGVDKNQHIHLEATTDESMEHLVDWSKPMLVQIGKLGNDYDEWVNKPVDRYLRIFQYDWLEALTRTPWWVVPLFWTPTIFYLTYLGDNQAETQSFFTIFKVAYFLTGILLWTLVEYALHRYVFHLDVKNASTATKTFHFIIHGLHHKVPFDPQRLVFPPIPACGLAYLAYSIVKLFTTCPLLVLSGGLLGYLCYDMIHFYLHYGSPSGGHLYHMKRYHYQHHFTHHELGFGISSQFWDDVFGTQILLKKLKYMLKW